MDDAFPAEMRGAQTTLLDRYMALHTQQSTYRRRASSVPASPDRRTSSSSSSSPRTSPTTNASTMATSPPSLSLSSSTSHQSPSIPTPSISGPEDEDSTDHALYEVNHAIKSTLTDLLNCEAVKADGKWRMWCQARLMDAELELKRQRRRRVSSGTVAALLEEEGRRESW